MVSKTKSTLADMESKASTASATAPKSDKLKTGVTVTGQWLRNTFVNSKEEQTKMAAIIGIVASTEPKTLAAAWDVARTEAKAEDAANGTDKDADGKKRQGPSYKSTANTAAVMCAVYGMLRFCNEAQAKAAGYHQGMGYQKSYVVAQKALNDAGLTWDGHKKPNKEQREAKRAEKVMEDARKLAEKENPRKPGENFADYYTRIDKAINAKVGEVQADADLKTINKGVEDLAKLTPAVAKAIAETYLASLKQVEKAAPQAMTGTMH